MANKKLIKELEGNGFNEEKAHCLWVGTLGGVLFHFNNSTNNFYSNTHIDDIDIYSPTFAQIAEKVLELTGVTLTPKQTKRQGIDKNTARSIGNNSEIVQNRRDIKKFNRNAEENRIATLATIDELKERIDALEKNTPLFLGMDFGLSSSETAITVIRNQGGSLFAKKITESEIESREKTKDNQGLRKIYEQGKSEPKPKKYGFIKNADSRYTTFKEGSRIEVTSESNFGATVKLVHYSEGVTHFFKWGDLQMDSDEPKKAEPKSEPEKTEGVFEVGDPVVLIKYPALSWSDRFSLLAKDEVVLTIDSLDNKFAMLRSSKGKVYANSFLLDELQHAPKEAAKVLEFGKPAELLVDYKEPYSKGATVLITDTTAKNGTVCGIINGWGEKEIVIEDLKAL